jgi:hypothetical protein
MPDFDPEFSPDTYAPQVAAALGLPLREAHLPGVLMNLALARRMAALVESVPLTPHDEPAPIFIAGVFVAGPAK